MKKEKIEALFNVYQEYLGGNKLSEEEQKIFIDAYLLGFNEAKLKYNIWWNTDKDS